MFCSHHPQAPTYPQSTPVSCVVLGPGGVGEEGPGRGGGRSPPQASPWRTESTCGHAATDQVSPRTPVLGGEPAGAGVSLSDGRYLPVSLIHLHMLHVCVPLGS